MPVSFSAHTGKKSSIPTGSPTQIYSGDLQGYQGVQLLAPTGNSGTVWVGFSSGMTINSNDLTDSFPLGPGTSILLPVRSINTIYVQSQISGQSIYWLIS